MFHLFCLHDLQYCGTHRELYSRINLFVCSKCSKHFAYDKELDHKYRVKDIKTSEWILCEPKKIK